MRLIKYAIFIVILILAGEIGLRAIGFGNPILYTEDKDIGYLVKANQNITKFGNRFYTNKFHQRSEELSNKSKIMILGNSIINGGLNFDQKETISEILESKLNIEVLSASAGSWEIINEYEYIKKFGFFNSSILVWQMDSNDLLQKKREGLVGSIFFPSEKPRSAIEELVKKFITLHSFNNELKYNKDIVSKNKKAINEMVSLAEENNVTILFLVTNNFENQGSITDFIANYTYIKMNLNKSYFRDNIHPNKKGNEKIAERIYEKITSSSYIS